MERNANRIRVIFITILIFICELSFGQKNSEGETVAEDYYAPVNFDISVNATKFKLDNDTIPILHHDYGIGLNVEKEIYYTTKFSLMFGIGLHHNKSTTENNNYAYRILSGRLYISPRYFLTNTISIFGGITGFYNIQQSEKNGHLTKWQNAKYLKNMQAGFIVGSDFLLRNWLSLRPKLVVLQHATIIEAGIVLTPSELL